VAGGILEVAAGVYKKFGRPSEFSGADKLTVPPLAGETVRSISWFCLRTDNN
jgi:hypothetical protein